MKKPPGLNLLLGLNIPSRRTALCIKHQGFLPVAIFSLSLFTLHSSLEFASTSIIHSMLINSLERGNKNRWSTKSYLPINWHFLNLVPSLLCSDCLLSFDLACLPFGSNAAGFCKPTNTSSSYNLCLVSKASANLFFFELHFGVSGF